jgi:hypothetical protein
MFDSAFDVMFHFIGVFYGIIIPLAVVHLIVIFFLPSLLKNNTLDMTDLGKAVYCYLTKLVGLILLTLGGFPTIYSVLSGQPLSDFQYIALLVIFGVGGFLFLLHDMFVQSVPKAARDVPHAIFFFSVKFIGMLTVVFSALSLALTSILQQGALGQGWWILHTLTFAYGLILWWCTSFDESGKDLFSKSGASPVSLVTKNIVTIKPFRAKKKPLSPKKPAKRTTKPRKRKATKRKK